MIECLLCCLQVMDQFRAARDGNLQRLRVVLTPNNVNNRDRNGWTALHIAAEYGFADCVKYCVEMHANVNAHENVGSTPLHVASLNDNVEVVRLLLDMGAIVDVTTNYGWTSLYCAIHDDHRDIAKVLNDRSASVNNVQLDIQCPNNS
jgi:ankyrin repeat protein